MDHFAYDADMAPSQVLASRTRRARKRHECTNGGWIEPGDKYEELRILFEGSVSTFRRHYTDDEGCRRGLPT